MFELFIIVYLLSGGAFLLTVSHTDLIAASRIRTIFRANPGPLTGLVLVAGWPFFCLHKDI